MKLYVFLFLSCLCRPTWAGGLQVGNAGEGVWINNKVVTRDLYEMGNYEGPTLWIGNETDDVVVETFKSAYPLELSPQAQRILLFKLADAEAIYPLLGQYLARAIRYYDWRLVDTEVFLGSEEGRGPLPQERRVPIANRFMSSIIVNRTAFGRLDDVNKVALILHEAVYSMMKVKVINGVAENDNVAVVRLITGSLFLKPTNAAIGGYIADVLTVPPLPQEMIRPVFRPKYAQMCLADGPCLRPPHSSNTLVWDNPFADSLPSESRGDIYQFCTRSVLEPKKNLYSLYVVRSPIYHVKAALYYAKEGHPQIRLITENISAVTKVKKYTSYDSAAKNCTDDLSKIADKIYWEDYQIISYLDPDL